MSAILRAHVAQIGPSTASGVARTHSVLIDRPEAKGGTPAARSVASTC